MENKKLFIFSILIFSSLTLLYAQDSTKEDSWRKHFNWKHHNLCFWRNEFKGNPTISIDYGFSDLNQNGLNGNFTKPNLLEARLGYTKLKLSEHSNDLINYNFHYLLVSDISTKLSGNSTGGNSYNTDLWREGFGWASGYGYKINDSFNIIPYYDYAVDWSQLNMNSTLTDMNDKRITDLYNNSIRFGTSTEAGIKINLTPNIQIGAGYERSIIFPRHIFWKWAGSVVIEAAGQGAVNNFVEHIMDVSPLSVPIVNFVLKNAVSYAMYELRKDKMNWPFDSAAPLTYDQFRAGITIIF